jgi:PAS domain-containing protein
LQGTGSILAYVHPDDQSKVQADWQTSITGAGANSIEYRLLAKLGHYEWIEQRTTPLTLDANGRAKQLMVTLSIITHRKLTEEKLLAQSYFPALNPGPILCVDPLGLIKLSNPAAVRLGIAPGMSLNLALPDLLTINLAE